MPNYRRNNRRRPYNRKRRGGGRAAFRRYGSKIGNVAYSALKLAKRLKDAVNIEYKYYDSLTYSTATYTGSVVTLNNMSQGTTDVTRVGDSIKVQNLIIRGMVNWSNQQGVARMMVIWDPQNKITAVSDLLESTGSAWAPYSPKKFDNRFQCRVLYDKTMTFHSNLPLLLVPDIVIPINEHTQFSGGSTTISTGALKLIYLSNSSGATDPYFTLYQRVTYTDN